MAAHPSSSLWCELHWMLLVAWSSSWCLKSWYNSVSLCSQIFKLTLAEQWLTGSEDFLCNSDHQSPWDTGCPEWRWMPRLCRQTRSGWMGLSADEAVGVSVHCKEVGPDGLEGTLSTLRILRRSPNVKWPALLAVVSHLPEMPFGEDVSISSCGLTMPSAFFLN